LQELNCFDLGGLLKTIYFGKAPVAFSWTDGDNDDIEYIMAGEERNDTGLTGFL